jgi:hypothetical protein
MFFSPSFITMGSEAKSANMKPSILRMRKVPIGISDKNFNFVLLFFRSGQDLPQNLAAGNLGGTHPYHVAPQPVVPGKHEG